MKSVFYIFIISFLTIYQSIGQVSVPNDWYHGSPGQGYNGISLRKAYSDIIKDKKTKTVIVAVIDSGIDIEHEDLKENIWINPGEIPNNGIDDDKNGYTDDVFGWNFIGGPDGKNVVHDSYAATRVYASLKYKYDKALVQKLNKKQKIEYDKYLKAKEIVEREINNAKSSLAQLEAVEGKVMQAIDVVQDKFRDTIFSIDALKSLNTNEKYELLLGKNLILEVLSSANLNTIDEVRNTILREIENDKIPFRNKLDFAYNIDYDPRKTIIKDNYDNPKEAYYGNNDVIGPDPMHGTHVGGIIGAVRNNDLGMDGIAPNVKLMTVRAVPDGDERDKDVANAIRYAVDNGASVINMSFGKGFSLNKDVVDEAIQYAAKKDVLLVHAAGNAGENNDVIQSYPTPTSEKKSGFLCKKHKKAKNWIEVGALSYKSGKDAIAPFSNYGNKEVDLFAPGMKIYSTIPNDEYAPLQGTSMASPVVAGVAAAVRSVYPTLTAEQVKEVLMKSVTPITQNVLLPGSKSENVSFSKLSVSGGVVNLESALNYAATIKGKKKIKEVKA